MLLTFLLPGLGQAWAGRTARGAAFSLLVHATFLCGLALGGALVTAPGGGAGALLASAAAHAVLGPSLAARAIGLGKGEPFSRSFEVATTYLVVAGLLNVLLAFDAWDAAGERAS